MMTWETFYDNYLGWADSTVSSRISQISDIQNADVAEIVDCCQCIDEPLACRLFRKAEKAQVPFTVGQVAELAVFISNEELLNTMAAKASGSCTQNDLEELNKGGIQDDVITSLAKRYSLQDPNEGAIWRFPISLAVGIRSIGRNNLVADRPSKATKIPTKLNTYRSKVETMAA